MNKYRIFANVTLWFHWVWVAILLFGFVAQSALEWYKPIHLVVLSTTICGQILFGGCPLTILENAFRRKYDPLKTYSGGFTIHYIQKHFGVEVSPWTISVIFIGIFIISMIILFF
jgi:hypothetical protein